MKCPDIHDWLSHYEREQARKEREAPEMIPECSECGFNIEDEYCIQFDDEIICVSCLNKNHVTVTADVFS